MKILIPREAWPSAIAAPLVARQRRRELDRPQRVQRYRHDRRARHRARPSRVCTSTRSPFCLTAATGASSRRSNGAPLGDRAQQRLGALDERHASARVLGQLEAVPGEGVPSQDRDRAGLGRAEPWASDSSSAVSTSRSSSDSRDRPDARRSSGRSNRPAPRARERRIVRVSAAPPARRRRTGPSRGGRSRRARRSTRCGARRPRTSRRRRRRLRLRPKAGAGDLGPGVGLVPVHPGAAVLDPRAVPGRGPGPPTEPVATL